ncbi:MAG TPA: UdgX family uracil-DNA binding protein [Polyangia bacterium]
MKPRSLSQLRKEAASCRACDLWERGTQTVFGAGPERAGLMLIGEQPGDREDLAGEPFVGPAGKLLDRALENAGLHRAGVYLTNVVKHFKWVPRGKRRIHEKPNAREIKACRPWLDGEIERVRPKAIVCLGATAAQALLGRDFRVSRERGEWIASELAPFVMATVHPASVLRSPDEATRHAEIERFFADILKASSVL